MTKFPLKQSQKTIQKMLNILMVVWFSLNFIASQCLAQEVLNLPSPAQIKSISNTFRPIVLKGITVNPKDPFLFDFLLDKGDANLSPEQIESETQKLVKYFLAALTVPDADLWVNLSPYEQGSMIPQALGITELGRDLLVDDYILKQVTAGLTNPKTSVGQEFWTKAYSLAQEQFGTKDVPINTFSKVWIVPDHAVVLEKDGTAFIADSNLKIFSDEDYLAIKKNLNNSQIGTAQIGDERTRSINKLSAQVIKEVVLPHLETEINQGENFVLIRQIYSAVLLATWYKKRLKESILGKLYADQGKVAGVNSSDMAVGEKIYAQYTQALKKGVYKIIKKDYDAVNQKIFQRKYFSGGARFDQTASSTSFVELPSASSPASIQSVNLTPTTASSLAQLSQLVAKQSTGPADIASSSLLTARVNLAPVASSIVNAVDSHLSSNSQAGKSSSSSVEVQTFSTMRFLSTAPRAELDRVFQSTVPNANQRENLVTAIISQREMGQLLGTDIESITRNLTLSNAVTPTVVIQAFQAGQVANAAHTYQTAIDTMPANLATISPEKLNSALNAAQASGYVFTPETPKENFVQAIADLQKSNPVAFRNISALTAANQQLAQQVSALSQNEQFRNEVAPTTTDEQGTQNNDWQALVFLPETQIQAQIKQKAQKTLGDAGKDTTKLNQQLSKIRKETPYLLRDFKTLSTASDGQYSDLAKVIKAVVSDADTFRPIVNQNAPQNPFTLSDPKILAQALVEKRDNKIILAPNINLIAKDIAKVQADPTLLAKLANLVNDRSSGKVRGITNLTSLIDENSSSKSYAQRLLNSSASSGVDNDVDPKNLGIRSIFNSANIADHSVKTSLRGVYPHQRPIPPTLIEALKRVNTALSQDPALAQRVENANNKGELLGILQGNPQLVGAAQLIQDSLITDAKLRSVGGIDFTADSIDLQIKRDGNGVPLNFSMQDASKFKIDGLTPNVLDIEPANTQNTPALLNFTKNK